MGRKRSRAGKQFYICIAGLIVVLLAGCTILKEMQVRDRARTSLLRGQKLLAQGDYEGSVRENQRVLSMSVGKPPGDEALFNLGLIYIHPGNPKKDYGGALALFRKLTKDYPQSPWVEQAKIWVGMLEDEERLNQAFKKLKEENERLSEVFKKLKEVDIEIEEKKREKTR